MQPEADAEQLRVPECPDTRQSGAGRSLKLDNVVTTAMVMFELNHK